MQRDVTLTPFDYDPRTRVVFGPGVLSQLGDLTRSYGGSRVLLVSDAGLKAAGHEQRAVEILEQAGLTVHLFDDVHPDPTTDDVERGLDFARDRQIDFLIGLGGGSSMDCAKGINFLLTNGGRMEDYKGSGHATQPMLPFIAVPTTAGTGSEGQSYAVIAAADTHMKMACGDKKALARVALLDPELTVTMPAGVTAATGIDAISHAVETFVTTRRNPVSRLFSQQAWRLLARAFPVVLREPENITARGAMLLGAHLAGVAIENSMLGATHALANPLSAHYGTTHGVAIGVMLPHVVRFNAVEVEPLYTELACDAGLCEPGTPDAASLLANHLQKLVTLCDQPTSLAGIVTEPGDLARLAEEAAQQWTGRFNPRPVTAEQLEELYRCALA